MSERPPIIVTEVSDPELLRQARRQRERADRNSAWLQAHVPEIYSLYRGKCVCVAGEELFVADTPQEAWALARAAHPEDDGALLRYIPLEKMERIYVAAGAVASL
jgi:hypothetical protein